MPIPLHIFLTYLTLFLGTAAVAFSVWPYWDTILNAVPDDWGILKSGIGFSIAVLVLGLGQVPVYFFVTRVPVRCRRAGCGGRALAEWSSPLCYTCSTCGNVERTSFGFGRR